MEARCPFYGYRWPDRTVELTEVGGNECGLDLDENGACRMELENLPVDYGHCLIALEAKPLLDMALQRIRFKPARATEPIAFRDWREQCLKRKA
jgi:hypothetical protein